MTLNHPPIALWEEMSIPIRRIITLQRHRAILSKQTGLNLNSQANDATLEKGQNFCCHRPKTYTS
jgi:hypothetical protein